MISKNRTFLIKFNEKVDVFRYGDHLNGSDVICLKFQIETLKRVLLKIINYFSNGRVVLTRYDEKWINDNENNVELLSFFKSNNLKINFNGGIGIEGQSIVEKFFVGNLRYYSFVHFLIVEKGIIITPTDHMDIFVNISNLDEEVEIIKKIVEENSELVFVETN